MAAPTATAVATKIGQRSISTSLRRLPTHSQWTIPALNTLADESISIFNTTQPQIQHTRWYSQSTNNPHNQTDSQQDKNNTSKVHQELPHYPTIAMAKTMPLAYRQMDNITLTTLAGMGQHAARREVLIRHIMATDNLEYTDALKIFAEIRTAQFEGMYLVGLPFQIGAITMFVGGIASVPLVFDFHTVEWFNQVYVTADVPPEKDLETWLEVGSWSWNWMEPVLGTGTFLLMCLQYFRINMDHLGIKPYTHRLKRARAYRLCKLFPKYDREILMNYSETATIYAQHTTTARLEQEQSTTKLP